MEVWLRDFTVVCDRWWKTASAEERYSNLILENVKRVSGQSKASCREKDKERKGKKKTEVRSDRGRGLDQICGETQNCFFCFFISIQDVLKVGIHSSILCLLHNNLSS